MRGVQKNTRWIVKIHRRLIRPPYPVLIFCPACGHGIIEVSADSIEIDNNIGIPYPQVKAKEVWQRIKHSCGAKIVLYWKD